MYVRDLGVYACLFNSDSILYGCAVFVRQVKLFQNAICLQSVPVVLNLSVVFRSNRATDCVCVLNAQYVVSIKFQ